MPGGRSGRCRWRRALWFDHRWPGKVYYTRCCSMHNRPHFASLCGVMRLVHQPQPLGDRERLTAILPACYNSASCKFTIRLAWLLYVSVAAMLRVLYTCDDNGAEALT